MIGKRKVAVGIGVLFGITSSLIAMMPSTSSGHADAAIAVIDVKNIEEAVKTAVQTANILDKEQQQLLLMMLNNKKLDADQLSAYLKQQQASYHEVWDEQGMYTGIGSIGSSASKKKKFDGTFDRTMTVGGGIFGRNSSADYEWKTKLGSIDDILNGAWAELPGQGKLPGKNDGCFGTGRVTVPWDVIKEQAQQKTLSNTYKDAAKSAANADGLNEVLSDTTAKALEDSNNAVGELQALQSGNVINAQGVQAILRMSQTYNRIVQAEAAHYEAENLRRARIETNEYNNGAKLSAMGQAIIDTNQ
ncbi:hypothetical protein [Mitsuokella multacida]